MKRPGRWIVGVLLVALWGCDSGPSGPGALEIIVSGDAVAGVLLQVDGEGIQGFDGLGDARVYAATDTGLSTRHRVVVITPGSGEMRLSIRVDDLEMEGPELTVLQATRADNRLVTPSAVVVRIAR